MRIGLNLQERIARMGPAGRGLSILLVITLGLFVAGFWAGFVTAAIDHGHILPRKPLGWAVVAAGVLATVIIVQLFRALMAGGGMLAGMTGFDRRYWKMFIVVGLLGVPIGIGMALAVGPQAALDWLAPGATLQPTVALTLAAALIITCAVAAFLYHRAIDDHEERAYLWGSQFGFYVLVALLAGNWLLEKGGLVPAINSSSAMLMVVGSFLVQAIVWAWLKFR